MAGGRALKRTSPPRDPVTGKITRKPRDPLTTELVKSWTRAHDAGIAGQLCDRIVRERPVPQSLLDVIFAKPPPARAPVTRPLPPPRPLLGRDGKAVRRPTGPQLEAIALYAEGLTYREIGKRLWLTASGVELRMQRAMIRTGASNPTHLVALALRARWIP